MEINSKQFSQAYQKLQVLQKKAPLELATVGGGCFWCLEAPFDHKQGVYGVVAGYSGGKTKNPTYSQVSTGRTGHKEVVQIFFDPNQVSYKDILELFWLQIDPTDPGGQFADRGDQYKTVIFYHSPKQHKEATESKKNLEKSGKFASTIETLILPFDSFFPAEDEHQSYYYTHPDHYFQYAQLSGRKAYLQQTHQSK